MKADNIDAPAPSIYHPVGWCSYRWRACRRQGNKLLKNIAASLSPAYSVVTAEGKRSSFPLMELEIRASMWRRSASGLRQFPLTDRHCGRGCDGQDGPSQAMLTTRKLSALHFAMHFETVTATEPIILLGISILLSSRRALSSRARRCRRARARSRGCA